MARASTAEKNLESAESSKATVPAYRKDVNFTKDRPGFSYHRYYSGPRPIQKRDTLRKHSDGKNPIRNFMRLLCRVCLSDEHLIHECPKLSSSRKVSFVNRVFSSDTVSCDCDECYEALDLIQNFDDETWSEYYSSTSAEISMNSKDINFNSLENSKLPDKEYQHTFKNLADRSFTHSLSHFLVRSSTESSELIQLLLKSKKDNSSFEGICMDNGAEKSVAGLEAYKRYCLHTNTPLDLSPSKETFRLVDGVHKSLGSTVIRSRSTISANFWSM